MIPRQQWIGSVTGRGNQMKANSQGRNKYLYVIGAFLVLIFLVYYPVLSNDFINYDDPSYVTANSQVKSGITGDSVKWAFTTFYFYNWHPLTWVSHMLDIQVFGLNPMGHHVTSLLFHITNSFLLFVLLKRMTGATWRSLCVASLFALHPLHAESVAWVADRKDVLSTFFWFLTMLAYAEYAKKPKVLTYLLCVLLFILGLMAKPMLVTLPLVLLLMDYWPLSRLRWGIPETDVATGFSPKRSLCNLVLEKIPLALISMASVIVTYLAQKKGGALRTDSSTIANAGHALLNYARYVLKMVWPNNLAVFYPYDPAFVSAWKIAMVVAGIIAVSILVVRVAKRLPCFAVGWLWYLIAFIPVIGFVRIGEHAMADRYTYVPLIGLFILAVWGIANLAERRHMHKLALTLLMIAIIIIYSVLTNLQARRWHDSVTLFRYALEVTENNSLAHKNLGAALANEGNLTEALRNVSESLRIKPDAFEYVSQGWLYLNLGNYEKAAEACKNSIAMLPDNDKAHFILGVSYIQMRDYPPAIAEYRFLKNTNSPYASRLLSFLNQSGTVLR